MGDKGGSTPPNALPARPPTSVSSLLAFTIYDLASVVFAVVVLMGCITGIPVIASLGTKAAVVGRSGAACAVGRVLDGHVALALALLAPHPVSARVFAVP